MDAYINIYVYINGWIYEYIYIFVARSIHWSLCCGFEVESDDACCESAAAGMGQGCA